MKKRHLITFLLVTAGLISCKNVKKSEKKIETTTKIELEEVPMTTNLDIIPIEHATAVLEWDGTIIYIDPVGGAQAFKGQKKPDLILITDIHGDHLSVETLTELDTSDAKIIAPQAVADKIPEQFTPQLDILDNGSTKERYNILVEAIPMYNLREEVKEFHTKGRGNGYILSKGNERIYFSGDTEDIPEMRQLQNIDKAFICMNLPYTMTEESAASAVLEFKPKQVYPYHYRGRPDVSNVTKFKKIVNNGNNKIEVVQLDWYPTEDY